MRGEPRYHAISGDDVQNVQILDDRRDQRRVCIFATLAAGHVREAGGKRDVLLEEEFFDACVSDTTSRGGTFEPALRFGGQTGA